MKRKKRLRRKEYLALERKKKDRQNKVLTGLFLALVFGGTAATFLVPTGKTGRCSSFRKLLWIPC